MDLCLGDEGFDCLYSVDTLLDDDIDFLYSVVSCVGVLGAFSFFRRWRRSFTPPATVWLNVNMSQVLQHGPRLILHFAKANAWGGSSPINLNDPKSSSAPPNDPIGAPFFKGNWQAYAGSEIFGGSAELPGFSRNFGHPTRFFHSGGVSR